MSIASNGNKGVVPTLTGGSPRGWSFIGAASECWTRWAYRYVYGLYPMETPEYFDLGSAYHALQEGKTLEEVTALYPRQVEEAVELIEKRKKGPPLPRTVQSIEKEVAIFGGLMTSKPDRVERSGSRTIVRDFKSAGFFSKNDDAAWNTDGGILGECIAGRTDTALVDIVSKSATTAPFVKIVTVKLNSQKQKVLERTVKDFWFTAEEKVTELESRASATRDDVLETFGQNLKGCVGKYSVCPYYSRCWDRSSMAGMMFRQATKPPRNWADYKPKISWRAMLDNVYDSTKGLV